MRKCRGGQIPLCQAQSVSSRGNAYDPCKPTTSLHICLLFLTMKGENRMSTEDNKALVRRCYDEVHNKKNLAAINEFLDPNGIDHAAPPGLPGGLEGAKQFVSMFLTAFPDYHVTFEDMIAEGDKVVCRLTWHGTHQGKFMGIPPTGKHVTF